MQEMTPINKLFKEAYGIFKNAFWQLLSIFILLQLVLFPLNYYMDKHWNLSFNDIIYDGLPEYLVLFRYLFAFFGVIVLTLIASAFFNSAILITLRDLSKGITIIQSLLEAKKYVFKYISVVIILWLLVIIGFILFIIPGIYMIILFSMSIWVLIYEDLWGFAAIKKSYELVRNNWWKVFFRFLLAFVLFLIEVIIVGMINTYLGDDYTILFAGLIQILFSIFIICYSQSIYLDLSKNKKNKNINNINYYKINNIFFGGIVLIILILIVSLNAISKNINIEDLSNMLFETYEIKNVEAINDIVEIQFTMEYFLKTHGSYPTDLVSLKAYSKNIGMDINIYDYFKKDYYLYKVGQERLSYELCFNLIDDFENEFQKGENCIDNQFDMNALLIKKMQNSNKEENNLTNPLIENVYDKFSVVEKSINEEVVSDVLYYKEKLKKYYQNNQTYPESLSEAREEADLYKPIYNDYDYEVKEDDFSLCFELDIAIDNFQVGENCINKTSKIK